MLILILMIAIVALAVWLRSTFLNILAGMLTIGYGIYVIAFYRSETQYWFYIMAGIAIIAIGLYLLINEAWKKFGGN